MRTFYNYLGGGRNNILAAGAIFGSIFSGDNNTVSGAHSPILGGLNNNDNGNACVGIYGTGVNGLALIGGFGGFFVNELVIQNIPVVTAGTYGSMQLGQVYTTVPPGSGFAMSPLFIA